MATDAQQIGVYDVRLWDDAVANGRREGRIGLTELQAEVEPIGHYKMQQGNWVAFQGHPELQGKQFKVVDRTEEIGSRRCRGRSVPNTKIWCELLPFDNWKSGLMWHYKADQAADKSPVCLANPDRSQSFGYMRITQFSQEEGEAVDKTIRGVFKQHFDTEQIASQLPSGVRDILIAYLW